jgi:hypothetical protein
MRRMEPVAISPVKGALRKGTAVRRKKARNG